MIKLPDESEVAAPPGYSEPGCAQCKSSSLHPEKQWQYYSNMSATQDGDRILSLFQFNLLWTNTVTALLVATLTYSFAYLQFVGWNGNGLSGAGMTTTRHVTNVLVTTTKGVHSNLEEMWDAPLGEEDAYFARLEQEEQEEEEEEDREEPKLPEEMPNDDEDDDDEDEDDDTYPDSHKPEQQRKETSQNNDQDDKKEVQKVLQELEKQKAIGSPEAKPSSARLDSVVSQQSKPEIESEEDWSATLDLPEEVQVPAGKEADYGFEPVKLLGSSSGDSAEEFPENTEERVESAAEQDTWWQQNVQPLLDGAQLKSK